MFANLFKRKTKYYPNFLSWAKYFIPKVKKEFIKQGINKGISRAMSENVRYQIEAFYRWESGVGSLPLANHVLGVAFMVTHLANHDCSMLEIVMYSRNGYKATSPVLSFESVDELFEWLEQKNTPEVCSPILEELLDILESEI